LHVIDDPVPRPAALNMAIDEMLLTTARLPVLRFYRWNEASVSFGYFGIFDEAQEFARGRALVRRWTGGGIVPHGHDLTYSIMIGPGDGNYALSSRLIYRRVHAAVERALRAMGVQAQLSEAASSRTSEACFANPVVADLIEGGRKIAGAAQRKTRQGILHQGSIQRSGLEQQFRKTMANLLSSEIVDEQISSPILESAEALAGQKYATDRWLRWR
jgi:lipoate-protein ligase A